QYFNVTRDTVTYEILETYKIGEKPQVTANGKAASATSTVKGQGEKV
ncbi:MAG: sarcosine oxidase subunit delta, partial [Pseudomonas sp.]|nr:sarcosine oxidase subunit delta [Pseudomonas sp.]